MENYKPNHILIKYKIELLLFFTFFTYFLLWFNLNLSNSVSNNDPFSKAIVDYNFTPYLSYIIDKLIVSSQTKIFLGSVIFPSLCALLLYKIFNKILDDKLWSLSLLLLSILSSENFHFVNFLKEIISFSDIYSSVNRSENFEIIGFPIPSFSIFYFLMTFYFSYRFISLKKNFLVLSTIAWLLGIHIHPVDGLFGLLYWTIFILINYLLQRIKISIKELVFIFLSYLLSLFFLFNNFDFQTLNINSQQTIPFYDLFFYFIIPILLILITKMFFKVDMYEFFLKFFAIYVLMFAEIILIAVSYLGYGIELQMLENRIALFLLHFLYYVPIIYYLSRDSVYYENSLEKKKSKVIIKKFIYFVFNKYKSFYLIPFLILLIIYAYLSLNI